MNSKNKLAKEVRILGFIAIAGLLTSIGLFLSSILPIEDISSNWAQAYPFVLLIFPAVSIGLYICGILSANRQTEKSVTLAAYGTLFSWLFYILSFCLFAGVTVLVVASVYPAIWILYLAPQLMLVVITIFIFKWKANLRIVH